MRDNANAKTAVGAMRRHGLTGCFASAAFSGPALSDTQAALHISLESSLPVQRISTQRFNVACTNGTHELADDGIIAVAGRPQFRLSELIEVEREEGSAAAVGATYRQFGSELFKYIYGAFAIVVFDTTKGSVLAGIDRLGQHTLYYSTDQGVIQLASEARGAIPAANEVGALAPQGIYNYVYFHMVPSPGSVYPGVNKLPAAHCLEFDGRAVSLRNYWSPSFREQASAGTEAELGTKLKEHLRQAVKNCAKSDGKIGAFLSGGLDSSSVTGMMAELGDSDAQAYSIGFSAEGYDEMAYARITAKHFGVTLNEYYVTPEDVVEALPHIATSYDEPFGNSSALPAYFCARMAAENGVTTLLAGDGGDEFFAGNERYLKQRVFDHYHRIPTFLRRGLIEPVARTLPSSLPLISKARSYIDQGNTPLPDRLQSYNFLHRHAVQEIFCGDFLEHVDVDLPLDIQREVYHRPENATDLNRMLYLDWQFTLADNDLRKVSHMCALAGVDVTYPMLDDALVEFSCSIPSELKIRQQDLRYFYKRALTGWLPHETIHKSKQGFGLPFGVWMRSYPPLREMAYDHLLQLKSRNYIRPEFIDRAIEMHQSEHAAYYGELVWILTVFELWLAGHSTAGD